MDQIKNKKNKFIKKHPAKTRHGSILAYSLIIIAMMIAIATSMSVATIVENKAASVTDFSVQAYQTADSGLQMAIKKINNNPNSIISAAGFSCDGSGNANDVGPAGSSYTLSFFKDGSQVACNVLANTVTSIKSTGIYKGTLRTINVGISNWITGPCFASLGILVYKSDVAGTSQWRTSNALCMGPQCDISKNLVDDNTRDFSGATNDSNGKSNNYPARQACKDIGGRLPTVAELQCINTPANKASYGSFQSSNYWSSGENSALNAKYVSFVTGNPSNTTKTTAYYVRCVK